MTTEIELPVSIGEGLDKLTILEIKLEKIKDARREDCQKEFNALASKLKPYLDRVPWHYKILKEINFRIWNLQDESHSRSMSSVEIGKLYAEVLSENDRRFRMKAKINHCLSSSLKEQKGYAKKKLFFYGHLGMGDMFWLCGAVRYFSTAYDEVVVVCKQKYETNVRAMYSDDPTISLFVIEDDYILYPFQQVKRNAIEQSGYEVKACGQHSERPVLYEFPYSFYDDIQVPRSARVTYFYIPSLSESDSLWQTVVAYRKDYIMVHQKSSQKEMPIWDALYAKDPTRLILDVNTNHYHSCHPFYAIAEKVKNQPLLHYKSLLENASEIHLLESSLYCMASHLDLSKVGIKKCYDAFDNSNTRLGIFETATL